MKITKSRTLVQPCNVRLLDVNIHYAGADCFQCSHQLFTMNCRNRGDGSTDISEFNTHVLPSKSDNRNEIRFVIKDDNNDHAVLSNVIFTLHNIECTFCKDKLHTYWTEFLVKVKEVIRLLHVNFNLFSCSGAANCQI